MSLTLPLTRRLSLTALALALAPLAHAQDASDAFKLKLAYTGEAAVSLDGGKEQGSAYAGQLMLGTDVDLQRLMGWNGATLKVYAINRHGTNLANSDIGNSTSVQEIYGGQGTRLTTFTLQQKLFDDRLELEAGRSEANVDFLGSALCGYFQGNSSCGNPTFVFRTSNFTYWPVSSWSAHAKAWLTPTVYVHVGAYEVNPTQAEDGQHGLNWSTRDSTGVIVPYAVGYKTDAASVRFPAMYELGGWQDNSDYKDPLTDRNGTPARLSGLDYAPRNGRSGAFIRFEQQVTRPDADSARGLVLFGSVLKGTSGQLIEDHFLELGLVQRGTFASREQDNIAFVVTQQRYSDKALEDLRLARAAAGGSGTPHSSQYMMELSYGIQVTPQLRIAPNLHYIVHPDQFNEPSRTRDLPNALVAGMRVDWAL
ncbi:carbohydrate porin [Xanthomonas translucens pv. translucens]|uniref:carbohydrate porin n=1 Tax=Xanthomonas campestris pv. translucens TaxID=343 RepID=UPI001F263B37|nr:carbohydrate porin [Xanthomonas translucens]MCS3359824.1 carbohydrate porin [Xanthomonas translucens pv. translucens]MCS3373626.1 carbohydrate porin [Xanthomonas translucens pv. translucens]MCT8289402.1 carbohydrate porin [Xanthomonas translucens pv. translucens]MCT8293081.1 carbohydrate porin [Xanthomonas translucens pv. translucens]MCT8313140.1 carbohydrate porin [Xanthomonas translucens pv. translucens]